MLLGPSSSALYAEPSLVALLEDTYRERVRDVLRSLQSFGDRYYFRVNTLLSTSERVLTEMARQGIDAGSHETIEEACHLRTKETAIEPGGIEVVADRFAAEAVLQGAHLYAPGVKHCHGLRAGSEATVVDENGHIVGVGKARQSETSILTRRSGLAVEIRQNPSGLPSLMDSIWYQRGEIYLQLLPAMVTCRVLDPESDDIVLDLNCAPGGKLSHICQVTQNKARVFGFDRNARKLERTRMQLERLSCQNYQLIPHDSRYVHLDYTLKADKVLVDPPCSGLGVTPKLSIDATADDVENLSDYQKQFLRAAGQVVKRGGTIVYSVCTITGPECEDVVACATEELGLELDEATTMVGGRGRDPQGLTQRFDPDLHEVGYFIARFRKS